MGEKNKICSMEKNQSYVNHETCKACAFCVKACPNSLLELTTEKKIVFRPEFSDLCVTCGHCMAVCPTASMHIEGLDYERDFYDVPKKSQPFDFMDFVKNRRAIRNYKSKPLPDDVIDTILEGITMAPMGFPPHKTQVTVVTDKEVLQKAQKIMTKFYIDLGKMMKKSFIRFMMKRKVSEETFSTIKNHVVPSLSDRIDFYEENKIDAILRNAPVLFIFHASKTSENHSEDAMIALTYGVLTAHSLGIGTCPISLVISAVNRTPELKNLFKIPEENEVTASFVAGYAKYPYVRGIKRDLKAVHRI